MARMTQRRKIHRFHLDGSGTECPVRFKEDVLAAEEPLEIRVGGRSFAVTMKAEVPVDESQRLSRSRMKHDEVAVWLRLPGLGTPH